jgi:hypothetical protein
VTGFGIFSSASQKIENSSSKRSAAVWVSETLIRVIPLTHRTCVHTARFNASYARPKAIRSNVEQQVINKHLFVVWLFFT